jgi:hypothetical protein
MGSIVDIAYPVIRSSSIKSLFITTEFNWGNATYSAKKCTRCPACKLCIQFRILLYRKDVEDAVFILTCQPLGRITVCRILGHDGRWHPGVPTAVMESSPAIGAGIIPKATFSNRTAYYQPNAISCYRLLSGSLFLMAKIVDRPTLFLSKFFNVTTSSWLQ